MMKRLGKKAAGFWAILLLAGCPAPTATVPPAPPPALPPAADTTPPANVSGLGGTAGNAHVTLNWTDPTDTDFSRVRITWSPLGGSPTQPLEVNKGLGTAVISGLTNGTEYTFTARSLDATGNISAGVTTKLTPSADPDLTPPGEVGSLLAAPGNTQATLSWTDPSDGDLANVIVTWAPTGGSPAQPFVVGKGVQTATITGLTNNTAYTFTVRTRDTSANTSAGLTQSVTPVAAPDTTPPTLGTGINFSGTTSSSTTVIWGAATDAITAQANLQYKLVRATSNTAIDSIIKVNAITGGDLVQDWSTADLSQSVTGLIPATTTWFAALVRDAAGNMALYPPQSVTTSDFALAAVEVLSPSGTTVNPLGLSLFIRFNKSLNTGVKGYLEYDHLPRIYKTGAAKFAPATMAKMEVETVITFTTTLVPNDTVVFTPLYGYARQTYANPKVGGFAPASGLGMTGPTTLTHTFTTTHVGITDTLPGTEQWNDQNIYFLMIDRFNNASTANDQFDFFGSPDHIAGDGKTYQGGDLAGLTARLDYLKALGITAIWMTAPVLQAWENAAFTSYHGYWTQDFLAVDPHLGTMKDLRDMVSAAHTRGIKVIMDVVLNHVGSLFNYPGASPNPWEPTFNAGGTYTGAWLTDTWATTANRRPPYFGDIGATPLWDFFTRKGGNAAQSLPAGDPQIVQGDFAGLRDVNTTNATVRARLLEIFKWWIANTNVDGFRIDTVKHVEAGFWTSFCQAIRTWTKTNFGKDFYMMAEVYSGSVAELGAFTHTSKLDSVLGFQMHGGVFDWNDGDNITVFKDAGTWSARPKTLTLQHALTATVNESNLNANSLHANGDGLTARQKLGYFIDNHDLNRFLNSASGTANEAPSAGEVANLRNALSWLYTWEGIPVLYYGTEQNYKQSMALAAGGEMGSGAGNVNRGNRPNLWQVANSTQGNSPWNETHDTFRWIRGLNQLRSSHLELRRGVVTIRWTDDGTTGTGTAGPVDDGILAHIRRGGTATLDDDILVVINAHPTQQSAPSAGHGNDMGTDWPEGTFLQVVPVPGFEASTSTVWNGSEWVTEVTTFAQAGKTSAVWFRVPPNSLRILRRKP